jgi:subtilase family serine protease
VDLRWEDLATNETSYEVQYRQLSSGAWTVGPTMPSDYTNAHVFVPAGFDYSFKVRALGANGVNSDFSNEVTVSVPAPDLVGSGTLTVKKKKKKYTLTATVKVKNQGNASCGESKIGVFSSTDTVLGTDDRGIPIKIGGQTVPLQIPVKALKAGEEVTLGPVTFSVTAGSYKTLLKKKYILCHLDTLGQIQESNETNNNFVGGYAQ